MDDSPIVRRAKTMTRDAGPRPPFQIRGHRHIAADLPRHWIVLPPHARERALQHPLLRGLCPTHVGFFPSARSHRADRPGGVEQAIFKYCVRGSGWWEVAGRRVEVKPGDLIVVPPGAPHAYASNPDRPWTLHWFHAAGVHVDLILKELGVDTLRPVIPLGQDGALVALFQDLEEALEQDYAFPAAPLRVTDSCAPRGTHDSAAPHARVRIPKCGRARSSQRAADERAARQAPRRGAMGLFRQSLDFALRVALSPPPWAARPKRISTACASTAPPGCSSPPTTACRPSRRGPATRTRSTSRARSAASTARHRRSIGAETDRRDDDRTAETGISERARGPW